MEEAYPRLEEHYDGEETSEVSSAHPDVEMAISQFEACAMEVIYQPPHRTMYVNPLET